MQKLGVGFSQYDWLPRRNDGVCFALSSKWVTKTLLGGNLNRSYHFERTDKGRAPKEKLDKYNAKQDAYVQLAESKAKKIAADQGAKETDLSVAELYDAVYEAESELADSWAQAIALKQSRGIKLRSSRDCPSLNWWARSEGDLDSDFALIYSFYYESSTCCGMRKHSGSHSVAFVAIGGKARYFDPNAGEFFFLEVDDGGTMEQWLASVDREIARQYVRKGSLEHSVVHHIIAS